MTPDTKMPDWLEPMAATLTQERFAGPEWIFERKIDGIRLLAFKNGADVRLLSRNRLRYDKGLAAIASDLPSAKHGDSWAIVKLVFTLAMAWGFTNLVFMLHYAHAHYGAYANNETGHVP